MLKEGKEESHKLNKFSLKMKKNLNTNLLLIKIANKICNLDWNPVNVL